MANLPEWMVYQPGAVGGVQGYTDPGPDNALQMDISNAFLYYSILGAIDPRNLGDAKGFQKTLQVPFRVGLALATLMGSVGYGVGLAIIDPKHKYQGGWDDTKTGSKLLGSRKFDDYTRGRVTQQAVTGAPLLTYDPLGYEYDAYYS